MKFDDLEGRELLELQERRRNREPIISVWDWCVRIGHWAMVFFFAIIYFRYRKFPLHAYAGYLILFVVVARLVWGVVGTRAARFHSFSFSWREVMDYARSAVHGHAGYYVSHNPLGSWMVFALLFMVLFNGIMGILLYSAGQQLGPLGALVPEAWEDAIKAVHKPFGHLTAAAVGVHIVGVLWATRLHRENYVLAMITGHKRVPRKATPDDLADYRLIPYDTIRPELRPLERWLNYRHPFFSTLLIMLAIAIVVGELLEVATALNESLPAF